MLKATKKPINSRKLNYTFRCVFSDEKLSQMNLSCHVAELLNTKVNDWITTYTITKGHKTNIEKNEKCINYTYLGEKEDE